MRKLVKYIVMTVLSVLLITGDFSEAFAASAELTGPGTVRAGDTITLSLKLTDNGKFGLEGELEYDSSLLTLSSATTGLKGWKLEQNGNTIILYDDTMENPLNGTQTAITLKFKVSTSAATGAEIKVSVKNMIATDGNSESNLGVATYTKTVARPLSNNANLSALSVAGASLNPGFSAGTTSYDIGEVPFSTSKLNITYQTEDANATVKITGNSLSVGSNTVSVVVTAENGASKTYKIKVQRAQDPNYQASSDATLSGISVSEGKLSPAFSKDVTTYVVYVPYESIGTKFDANGTPSDKKAIGVTGGTVESLVEGKNTAVLTVKAEDGSTKDYTIIVYVMPQFAGTLPQIGEGQQPEEPPVEEPTETEKPSEEPETDEQSSEKPGTDTPSGNQGNDSSVLVTVLVVIIILLVCALVGVLCKKQILELVANIKSGIAKNIEKKK